MYKIINRKKFIATIILDTIGKIVFWLPRRFCKAQSIEPESISSILLIRTAYIGDVVMTLPIAKMLKKRFPDAQITFLTSHSARPLVESNPFIDEVLCYDAFWFFKSSLTSWLQFIKQFRRRNFDLVIEARADIRDLVFLVFFSKANHKVSYDIGGGGYLLTHVVPYPGLTHKVDYHVNLAHYLGCSLKNVDSGLYLQQEEINSVADLTAAKSLGDSFIAVHPGSRLFLKRWPLERCAELCDKLIDSYEKPIAFVGAPAEKELVEEVQKAMEHDSHCLAGALTLRELGALLQKAELFICNDSAPMHIAAAMGTKTVAIFGPSKSVETGPYGTSSRVVEKEVSCRSGCDENHCHFEKYHACMEEISVADVFDAASELLDS